MAALDFPDNPTNGQVFDKWTWNGTMWVLTASGSGGGGSGFTFNQDAMPTATKVGDTWFETDTGDSFVWTNDGNSTQWVQFAPGSGGGGGGSTITIGQRGVVALAKVTAGQADLGPAVTDLVGMTVTFDAVAGRRYNVTARHPISSTVAGDIGISRLINPATGGYMQKSEVYLPVASTAMPLLLEHVFDATVTGSTTLKLAYFRSTGTGVHGMYPNASYPAHIVVEDVTFEAGGVAGGGGGGSGFTYVTDTKPTPSKVGDTWFDTSTLASGGTSWLAIEESPGGEKVWVQFAPGQQALALQPVYRLMTFGAQSFPGSAITVMGFTAVAGQEMGGVVGNRTSGYFSITEKGVYAITVGASWSTSFGGTSLAMDFAYTDNQGAAVTSLGTQLVGPSPWAQTENVFMVDVGAVNPVREYNLRIYNYIATLSTSALAVYVTRVSARP